MTDATFVIYPHDALGMRAQRRPIDAKMLAAAAAIKQAAVAVAAHGLAAAHLGLNEPVVVVNRAADPARRDYLLLFNPDIVEAAANMIAGPEGSVSMPGIEVVVERPAWIRLAYQDEAGGLIDEHWEGFPARVAQHEIDQMNGIFFLSRLSRIKRDAALRKFRKHSARKG